MKTAIFPGTFYPFTIGHQSIVERGLRIFDHIIIAIGYNEHKTASDDIQSRVEKISGIYSDDKRVTVTAYSGLTTTIAQQMKADCILRGVRNVADFEYERNMADINRRLTGIETLLMYTLPELSCISGSVVRELSHNDIDITEFLAH